MSNEVIFHIYPPRAPSDKWYATLGKGVLGEPLGAGESEDAAIRDLINNMTQNPHTKESV